MCGGSEVAAPARMRLRSERRLLWRARVRRYCVATGNAALQRGHGFSGTLHRNARIDTSGIAIPDPAQQRGGREKPQKCRA